MIGVPVIRDKKKKILTDQRGKMKRWRRNFENLMNIEHEK